MKVLQVVGNYGSIGGIETYVADVCRAIERCGHTNVVAFDAGGANTFRAPQRVEYAIPGLIDYRLRLDAAAARRLREMLATEQPDVAYVHDYLSPGAAEALLAACPTVFFYHVHILHCPAGGRLLQQSDVICPYTFGVPCLIQPFLERCNTRRPHRLLHSLARTYRGRRWVPRADAIVVDSTFMQRSLVELGIEAARLHILPSPISHLPEPLPYGAREPLVAYVGRVTQKKGLRYLMEALARVSTPFVLEVAGDGDDLDRLRALARHLAIGDRLRFRGALSRAEVDDLYRRAALVVVPSVWPEPFGMVGPEAMSFGKPVVAFAVGGIPDWLQHGETGFLVEPRDVVGLAARIEQLLGDEALARRLGAAGRAVVEARFTLERHIDGLLRLFRQVIAGRASRAGTIDPW